MANAYAGANGDPNEGRSDLFRNHLLKSTKKIIIVVCFSVLFFFKIEKGMGRLIYGV